MSNQFQQPHDLKNLIAIVDGYKPFDRAEAIHKTAVLDWLHRVDRPLDADCFEPGHITGSAWIVCKATQQVALIFHQTLKRWLQPGGHAEPSENNPLSVALREAQEEVGVSLAVDQASLFDLDVHEIPSTSRYPSHWHFDFRYLCLSQPQLLVSGSDAVQARWFSASELAPLDFDAGLQRLVDKSIALELL